MTNPFPFTAGDVLNAADLNAIGVWTDYTPTFVNISFSSYEARYTTVNEIAIVQFEGVVSSVSATFAVKLPTAAEPTLDLFMGETPGAATAYDASTNRLYNGWCRVQPGTSDQVLFYNAAHGGTLATWSATGPIVWAAGDALRFGVIYTIAP